MKRTDTQRQDNPTPNLPSWIDKEWITAFRGDLLRWYRRHGRSLPWRQTRDPYAILVSEIMLQQTQAATVIEYFRKFLIRFPTIEALASADESEVLRQWEGLGYYRRAKNLHRAAKTVLNDFSGTFPDTLSEIMALPGIGRYTAGAVASFAFDRTAPIVEANTQRLYARLLLLDKPLQLATSQRLLWGLADQIVERGEAAELNHALMDLGSMICKPKSPSCLVCPVRKVCKTCEAGLQDSIPAPKKKTVYVEQNEIAVALIDGQNRLLLRKRPIGEWWAGLWDLPRQNTNAKNQHSFEKITGRLSEIVGSEIALEVEGTDFRHSVTHHRITSSLHVARFDSRAASKEIDDGSIVRERQTELKNTPILCPEATFECEGTVWVWAQISELDDLALSSSGRKMIDWLQKIV